MSVPLSASSSVTLSALTYEHPDGTRVFDGLDATFTVGRTGLVGRNGSGKSTLLQLISGQLTPARGSVTTSGHVAYLPQDITLDPAVSVATVLGIDAVRTALRRIESGDGTGDDFGTVGDRWDVEERALATMHRLGLDRILHDENDFDRTVGTLSGGETVLLGLTARLLAEPGVLLLDEPTNNLDTAARERLQDALDRFPGTVIIAGHDRDLLDRMDTIAEMRDGSLRMFGGGFSDYEQIIEAEQEAAQAAVRDARSDVRRQARELAAAHVALDRRARYGKKMFENKREPKIIMNMRKRQAQESAGKYRREHEGNLESAGPSSIGHRMRCATTVRSGWTCPTPRCTRGDGSPMGRSRSSDRNASRCADPTAPARPHCWGGSSTPGRWCRMRCSPSASTSSTTPHPWWPMPNYAHRTCLHRKCGHVWRASCSVAPTPTCPWESCRVASGSAPRWPFSSQQIPLRSC